MPKYYHIYNCLVVELTTANFDSIVGKQKYVVVKFYTRWCGYCRQMAPEYDNLFDIYKDKREDIVIARLEGSINQEISYKYGIFSFPMVVLFVPGDDKIKALFQGKRVSSVMSEWIESSAPVIENRMLQVREEKKETHLDGDVIIVKANKTEVTDELDFLRREILTMKNKIENLESEYLYLKNVTKNYTEFKENNWDNLNNVNNLNKKNIEGKEKSVDTILLKIPSVFELCTYFACLSVFIALVLTIKRICFKKSIKSNESTHAKV